MQTEEELVQNQIRNELATLGRLIKNGLPVREAILRECKLAESREIAMRKYRIKQLKES